MKDCKVRLKDGTIITGDDFDQNDFEKLKSIFKKWLDINSDLKSLKGRGLNVPDVFSEASIPFDCTSFGPTSTWDLLYYADFAPNGYVDGNVYFYEIDSYDVYGLVLNQKKNETFADQQAQGRRPRFSMKSRIIIEKGLEPVKKISLVD